ncbi:hypothetical protein [Metabacillus rhizolycopersici]|nr:hypothetical protein [Metabacillus rhizolycopersici]
MKKARLSKILVEGSSELLCQLATEVEKTDLMKMERLLEHSSWPV